MYVYFSYSFIVWSLKRARDMKLEFFGMENTFSMENTGEQTHFDK